MIFFFFSLFFLLFSFSVAASFATVDPLVRTSADLSSLIHDSNTPSHSFETFWGLKAESICSDQLTDFPPQQAALLSPRCEMLKNVTEKEFHKFLTGAARVVPKRKQRPMLESSLGETLKSIGERLLVHLSSSALSPASLDEKNLREIFRHAKFQLWLMDVITGSEHSRNLQHQPPPQGGMAAQRAQRWKDIKAERETLKIRHEQAMKFHQTDNDILDHANAAGRVEVPQLELQIELERRARGHPEHPNHQEL